MDHRSPELMSQEAMEISLIKFAEYLTNSSPDAICSGLAPQYIRCNFEESTMVYRYETHSWMRNPGGALHGGVIAAMIDTTMGSLSYYMSGEKLTPTITMKVDYVAPGRMEYPVYVGCKCTRCGGIMGYYTCKAWQVDEDKPIVTADGVYFAGGSKS